ncbi:MAG: MFS transporter [Candidatus Bathyarchaeia archaeon]
MSPSDGAAKTGSRKFLGLRGNALTISITELVTGIGMFLTSPFWSLYALSLGASVTSLGFLQMFSGLLGVFLMVPGGYLADKIGRKRPVVIGGLVATLGSVLQAFAQDWVQLIPGMVLSSGMMMTWPARQSMVADDMLPEERVPGFAAFFTLMMLPSAVMPTVSGYVMDYYGLVPGMRMSFIAAAALGGIATVLRVRFISESRSKPLQLEKPGGRGARLSVVLRDAFEPLSIRAVRTLFLGCSGIMLIFGFQQSFSSVYAVEVIRLSKTEWGVISGFMGVASLFMRIPIARLTVRIGERNAIIISQFGRSVYPAAFALSTDSFQLMALGLGYTAAFNLGSPAFQALLTEMSPPEKRGRVYGLWGMVWGGATSVSPALAGLLWELWGAATAFYIASAAGALSTAYLLLFRDRLAAEELRLSEAKT